MIFLILLLFVPLSAVLAYVVHAPPLWVFATAILALVPLAEWIRRATEQIARRSGPALGGLLNVTFGNATELILALFVLAAGQPQVVKAQITGSIIGNSLLGLGMAIVAGGWNRAKQTFSRERAGLLSSLLLLSLIALLLPDLFDYTERGLADAALVAALDERLSLCVSVVLILVYLLTLAYVYLQRRDLFGSDEEEAQAAWPLWKALGVLAGATALTALEAELVAHALDATASRLGLTTFFLGIIVLAIVGNVAEYLSAVYFARQDRMGLVMSITVGSSIQVALLTAPVLVIVSYFMGHPMNLVFRNPLELLAFAGAAFAVSSIARDGETTWIEGVLLLTVYVLLGLAFFFMTPGG